MTNSPIKDCACEKCQALCRHTPGWFMPDQIGPLAAAMNLTERQLFERHLTVDVYLSEDEGEENVFVLRPARADEVAGGMTGFDPRGTCSLYRNGRCDFHASGHKPFECAQSLGCAPPTGDEFFSMRRQIVEAWDKPEVQAAFADLLGRPLEAPRADILTAFLLRAGAPPVGGGRPCFCCGKPVGDQGALWCSAACALTDTP